MCTVTTSKPEESRNSQEQVEKTKKSKTSSPPTGTLLAIATVTIQTLAHVASNGIGALGLGGTNAHLLVFFVEGEFFTFVGIWNRKDCKKKKMEV